MLKPRLLTFVPAFLAAWLFGTGCGSPFGPTGCTLIGCDSGLRIVLDRPAPDGTAIRLDPRGGPAWTVVCGEDVGCDRGEVFFNGMLADWVHVTVSFAGDSISAEYRPEYGELFPNGEECGAVCTQGEIAVSLPGAGG